MRVYLVGGAVRDEQLGIRIEDDIVVTAKGCKNLSKAIPKSVAAIEKVMT